MNTCGWAFLCVVFLAIVSAGIVATGEAERSRVRAISAALEGLNGLPHPRHAHSRKELP